MAPPLLGWGGAHGPCQLAMPNTACNKNWSHGKCGQADLLHMLQLGLQLRLVQPQPQPHQQLQHRVAGRYLGGRDIIKKWHSPFCPLPP